MENYGEYADEATVEDEEPEVPLGPSKSQFKREHLALQALAERLTAMPRVQLERLRLSDATWAAIEETGRIKDIRARGRHYKRIANLLEREDMHAVHALMDQAAERERADAAHHHGLERWRERLIGEGNEALSEFLDEFPQTDRQQLRTLIRAAKRDTERGRPEAPRKLFRFLRTVVDAHGEADEALENDDRSADEDEWENP
ncbi:ribosome biogenesis factor YjgA [uncultured Thiodictyon sp.]|uniref:ribosome biogenesis factor YjgA n=1 Tax=uncultured Thiodictyon sp. TaxID=1846217 RepID=UPI0025E1DDCA|nr:ribosome biogenesis factor YjgA [uncultured Thiodictyon sp.]